MSEGEITPVLLYDDKNVSRRPVVVREAQWFIDHIVNVDITFLEVLSVVATIAAQVATASDIMANMGVVPGGGEAQRPGGAYIDSLSRGARQAYEIATGGTRAEPPVYDA